MSQYQIERTPPCCHLVCYRMDAIGAPQPPLRLTRKIRPLACLIAPDDLDLISSDDRPSLLPSPDSARSAQKLHGQPVSCSSQAQSQQHRRRGPTSLVQQPSSEPAAPSAGTVTFSGRGGDRTHSSRIIMSMRQPACSMGVNDSLVSP